MTFENHFREAHLEAHRDTFRPDKKRYRQRWEFIAMRPSRHVRKKLAVKVPGECVTARIGAAGRMVGANWLGVGVQTHPAAGCLWLASGFRWSR